MLKIIDEDIEDQTERTIAKKVIEGLTISTPRELDQNTIYKDGISILDVKETFVKQRIKKIAKETIVLDAKEKPKQYYLSIARQNIIIDFIKSLTYCYLKDFDSNDRIINLKNGLYFLDGCGNKLKGNFSTTEGDQPIEDDIETKYFMTHKEYIDEYGKPYKSFIQIPVNYDPKAENREIDEVLCDIVGINDVALIYEVMGYFLVPHVKYSKAFMLYGDTGTGKTTIINIVRQFFGNQNISGVALQKLDDKFEIEKTRNKLINIFDDLSSKPIEYVGNFKALVTNSRLYGRIKHIQNEIDWLNRCKGLFACNVLPAIKYYVTDAFYKRWVLIPCYNNLNELETFSTEIRDKQYSESELSGLLIKLLQALIRLEERKNFPRIWQDIDFVKNYWNMDINPVKLFCDENCDIGEEVYEVDYDLFYTEVNNYRKAKQVKEITKNLITRSLNKLNDKIGKPKKVNKKSSSIEMFPSGHKYRFIRFKQEYIEKNLEFKPSSNLDNILNINKEINR